MQSELLKKGWKQCPPPKKNSSVCTADLLQRASLGLLFSK